MALRYFSKFHRASVYNLLTAPSSSVVCNANFVTLQSQRCQALAFRKSVPSIVCGCGSTYFVRNLSSRPVKLAYDALEGDPAVDSSPIVILHGLFGSKNNWSSLAKKINIEVGRKVVAVDARNHGSSEHDDEMSYEAMGADIVNLIQNELNVEKCTLIGHSMGGKTAMYLALTKPAVVDSLLVVDMTPTEKTGVEDMADYMTALMNIEFDNSLSLSQVRRNAANQMMNVIPDENLRYFMVTNIIKEGDVFKWRINLKAILENKDRIAGFPKIDKPYQGLTEFVGGGNSDYIGRSTLPEIKRLFPEAIIRMINGAGHWVHAEKPYEFLEIVRPFLTST